MKNPDWLSCLGYSLRVHGRRSKGKRKGVRTREKARGRREERPPRSRAPKFPLPLPFLTSTTQATLGIENPWLFTTLHGRVSFFFLTYSWIFPMVNLPRESAVTRSTPISRGKRFMHFPTDCFTFFRHSFEKDCLICGEHSNGITHRGQSAFKEYETMKS